MKREAHYLFSILISVPLCFFLKMDPISSILFIFICTISSRTPDILEKRKGKKHRGTLHSKIVCIIFLLLFLLLVKKNPLISSFFLGYASHIILDSLTGKTPWI
ncbi:MAG TPA: hypothetical protein ENG56_00830 [Candidatus Aenigmarchaeota archaeon]|nr:hypothetical protein [Candidatus Aenigmarchaeota archaeon]